MVIDGGGPTPDLHAAARALVTEMRRITDADAPISEELRVLEEAIDHFTRAGWHDAVAGADDGGARVSTVPMVTCGGGVRAADGPLAPRTGMVSGFSLGVEDGAFILRHAPEGPLEPAAGLERARVCPRGQSGGA